MLSYITEYKTSSQTITKEIVVIWLLAMTNIITGFNVYTAKAEGLIRGFMFLRKWRNILSELVFAETKSCLSFVSCLTQRQE